MFKNTFTKSEYSYILGFLHGDGTYHTQSRNRGRISIELSIKDIDILDKLEKVILKTGIHVGRSDRTREIEFKDKNKEYSFTSCNLTVYDLDFRKFFNLPNGKKSALVNPYEYEIIRSDYIRGFTDADGSLGITGKNRAFWSLTTASEDLKNFILEDLYNVIGVEKQLNRNKRDNIYNISQFDEGAVEYARYLYGNSTLYLDRKYEKFLEICSWTRTAPRRTTLGRWQAHEIKVLLMDDLTLDEKMKILKGRSKRSITSKMYMLSKSNKN